MAYQLIETNDGSWAVDWEIIRRIVRSYCITQAINDKSRSIVASESRWYNPFSWNLPDQTTVDVDWTAAEHQADAATDAYMGSIRWNSKGDFRRVFRDLRDMQRDTRKAQQRFRKKLTDAQERTMKSVREAVDDYDNLITGAKLTRDASASTLLVGATVVSGGAATAALVTAGSGMKGVAKYQDTGNVGAATMEVAGSVIFSVIPIKAGTLGTGEKVALVLTEAIWEGSTAIVEGKTIGEAAMSGSLKIVEPAVGSIVKTQVVSDQLERWALPAAARVVQESPAVLMKFVSKETEMFGKMALGKGHGAAKAAMFSQGKASQPPAPQNKASGSTALRKAAAWDTRLLNVSAINMESGITVGELIGVGL